MFIIVISLVTSRRIYFKRWLIVMAIPIRKFDASSFTCTSRQSDFTFTKTLQQWTNAKWSRRCVLHITHKWFEVNNKYVVVLIRRPISDFCLHNWKRKKILQAFEPILKWLNNNNYKSFFPISCCYLLFFSLFLSATKFDT